MPQARTKTLRISARSGAGAAVQFGVDEALQVTVHDPLRIAHLVLRAVVLDAVVIENITADLGAPTHIQLAAPGCVDLGLTLLLRYKFQLALDNGKRAALVLFELPLGRANDSDTCGLVDHAYGRCQLVDVLASRTRRSSERLDLQIVIGDLDVAVVAEFRNDFIILSYLNHAFVIHRV